MKTDRLLKTRPAEIIVCHIERVKEDISSFLYSKRCTISSTGRFASFEKSTEKCGMTKTQGVSEQLHD